MRRRISLLPLLLLVTVSGGGAVTHAPRGGAASGFDARLVGESLQVELGLLPSEAMLQRSITGSDAAPHRAFLRGMAQAEEVAEATTQDHPGLAAARWELIGPTNIGGRVLDVVVDPELPDTIYTGAASGGVWKSEDAGRTFSPAWPADLTQSIGALAITPSGVLYAGTGETGPGGGSITFGGTGVYRSLDRGETWEHIGLTGSSRVSRIVIDPANEQRVFVAASGPLFTPGGQRGLYLSEDGGDTWNRVLKGDNDTTGAVDVAIDPSNPNKIFAAMWDHLREPDRRRYNGVGSGLYLSTDGGKTWARTGLGLYGPHPGIGRIGIAIAASDPKIVYGTISGESGAYAGMYKSTDGGVTWTPIADPDIVLNNYVYGWWFGRVWVDPTDANRVFQAGVDLAVSSDGGQSWGYAPGVHADQHGMAWDPKVPGRVYLGNDGGVYRSDDSGSSWEFGRYQPWSQLYSLDVGEQNPRRQVAGLQDNGVNRSYRSNGTTMGPDQWNVYIGGDGERALINPVNQQIVYGCYQYGECSVSTNGGNSSSSFTLEIVSERKNWFTPIEFDPANPSIVYTGGNRMSRSNDNASNWTLISGDLSNGPGRETNPLFRNYGTLTTIAPAPSATGIIYAGTDDGNLWYTRNGGAVWTKATDLDLPTGTWITRVEVDRTDPNTAYVTYSGFRSGSDAPYVLKTTDGGVNWLDITGNLPRTPLNDVNAIGDDVVVAGDLGVFITYDDGRNWYRVGGNLPLAPVNELRWHEPTRTLYAGTFGRSAWKIDCSHPGVPRCALPLEEAPG